MSIDLLLDTNVVLWLAAGVERAETTAVRPYLADPSSTVTVSVATWMEIAIKASIGKLDVDVIQVRNEARSSGLLELPIITAHALGLRSLPLYHRDPFDRVLIAQAMAEGMTIATGDSSFALYEDVALLGHG